MPAAIATRWLRKCRYRKSDGDFLFEFAQSRAVGMARESDNARVGIAPAAIMAFGEGGGPALAAALVDFDAAALTFERAGL